MMNIDTVKALLDAIEKGDAAAMAEICKQLIAEAASGDAAAPAVEPDGDPLAQTGGAPIATDEARVIARKENAVDDMKRARKAADEAEAALAEIKAMADHQRPAQKEALVVGLRARLGPAFKPASEKRIMTAPTFVAAQEIAAVIEESLSDVVAERARSSVEHGTPPPPPKAPAMPSVEALRTEGFTDSWLVGYASALKSGPDIATAFLEQGRASQRARVAQKGGK